MSFGVVKKGVKMRVLPFSLMRAQGYTLSLDKSYSSGLLAFLAGLVPLTHMLSRPSMRTKVTVLEVEELKLVS